MRLLNSKGGGPIGSAGWSMLSQVSVQMLTLVPLPTCHSSPLSNTSRPARILRHPCERLDGAEHSKKEEVEQYLPNRIRASSDGALISRQPIFARRTSWKAIISLNPRPSAFLGNVRCFQDTQLNFRWSSLESHQNRVRIDWISLHKEIRILKHDMV